MVNLPADVSLVAAPPLFDQWKKDGFFMIRNFFSTDQIELLRHESDRLLTEHRHLISLRNLRCRYMPHHETGELLFEVFDPVNDISPVCTRFCDDARLAALLESLYGEPACLFKEKLIFKPPGAQGYQLHQDIPQGWKGFPRTFLTVLIPIDPSTEENGCTEVFSGYHNDFLMQDSSVYMLPDDIVDPQRKTCLALNPGDIAVFHGLTPHRSEPNRSTQMRRVFYVSYNALSDGGDQRDAHYAEFRERLAQHRAAQASASVYFE
ncbi:phytanoyl-CoA dioxygenase family protein [Schlesneria sp.]|uniref:phytanoyl-CoA dioxygenase family protein n=1 Tax=Schlesneria sp. TaxID=2762018 RepID=UPI002EE69A69